MAAPAAQGRLSQPLPSRRLVEQRWSDQRTGPFQLQDISDSVRAAIRKDVPRSFPEYTFFEDIARKSDLENVLAAYAACDPEVGYCQGLNFLAGCVQLYAPDPEDAFATLHVLLAQLGMRALFLPDFAAAQVRGHA